MSFVVPLPAIPCLNIHQSDALFPVHRIYCVGRNYADHAKEMGAAIEKQQPVFFTKPADALVIDGGAVPYPSATSDLHHEVEWVIAIGQDGKDIAIETAYEHIYGYAIGLDLTRRDLQAVMKAKSLPWDIAKAFDASAPISKLRSASEFGHPIRGNLSLRVNGDLKQSGDLSEMIFSPAEIIFHLSRLFYLRAGDLIFTGTPSGVGPLQIGDLFEAQFNHEVWLSGWVA